MISTTNIQRHDDVPFTEYLRMPGNSHSFLRYEKNGEKAEIIATEKMKRGSMVDSILTDKPQDVDMSSPLYEQAKQIAYSIRKNFGGMIDSMEKQVSFTAEMEHLDHKMIGKFRLDFLLPGYIVLDLKVTDAKPKQIPGLITHMGYDNQLWGYSKVAQVDRAFILAYSVPAKNVFLFNVPVSSPTNEFWEGKILKFGTIK